jgi:hypothetical protein
MNNSALSRLLTARAKALLAKTLPILSLEKTNAASEIIQKKFTHNLPEPRGEWTTTWNDGCVVRERCINGIWITKIY